MPEGPQPSFLDALVLAPRVVAGQIDVGPMNGSDVLQAGVIEVLTLFARGFDCLFEVDGIPENGPQFISF